MCSSLSAAESGGRVLWTATASLCVFFSVPGRGAKSLRMVLGAVVRVGSFLLAAKSGGSGSLAG
jgi:hypothetical protein